MFTAIFKAAKNKFVQFCVTVFGVITWKIYIADKRHEQMVKEMASNRVGEPEVLLFTNGSTNFVMRAMSNMRYLYGKSINWKTVKEAIVSKCEVQPFRHPLGVRADADLKQTDPRSQALQWRSFSKKYFADAVQFNVTAYDALSQNPCMPMSDIQTQLNCIAGQGSVAVRRQFAQSFLWAPIPTAASGSEILAFAILLAYFIPHVPLLRLIINKMAPARMDLNAPVEQIRQRHAIVERGVDIMRQGFTP